MRYRTIESLDELGFSSSDVLMITGLLQLLKIEDSDVSSFAAELLVDWGINSSNLLLVMGLLRLLKDENSDISSGARKLLFQWGSFLSEAVTEFLTIINGNDSNVSFRIAQSLAQLGDTALKTIMRFFDDLIRDQDSNVSSRIAQSLSELATPSSNEVVVIDLLNLLQNKDFSFKYYVAKSLNKLRYSEPEAMTDLLSFLQNEDPNMSSSTGELVIQLEIESSYTMVLTGLLYLFHGKDSDRSSCARELLLQWKEPPLSRLMVMTGFLNLIKEETSDVNSPDRERLIQWGFFSSEVVMITGLLSLLQDEDIKLNDRAKELLFKWEESLSLIVIDFLALVREKYLYAQHKNLESLRDLETSISVIEMSPPDILNRRTSERCRLAESLGRSGEISSAVNVLLILIEDNDSSVRYRAATSLGQLGYASPDVLNGLLNLLEDKNLDVRYRAAESLGQLGYASPNVLNGLLNLLVCRESNEYTYDSVNPPAAKALIQLSKKSDQVQPALVQWIQQHQEDGDLGAAIDLLWEMPHPPHASPVESIPH